ncbi:UDP-glucose 4-epimerase GalE [Marinactinospora thermotolerans]|uniref:UDP-glucose 4-epimerase n=1 Tax=Marinactinospora thermotolerans DSM 45154 TaxID=1122192 RepID=A0A1T4QSI9_9ACTN|nr:UDP-glucose 4-epimerase GalE [Marinactinospora thermotolerans]SKA06228.1 UDP-galactose 4-epimerase [Marinactinospora thermotolerans DSM 45154]
MRVLVTGGAGYIGSVVASRLVESGHDVVVLDNLSTGHRDAVPEGAAFVEGDVREHAAAILSHGIDAVLHFAARSIVPESVAHPELYWEGNVGVSLALLEAMRATGVRAIVFSSTAAVYGEPESVPIPEEAPVRPTNPYGATKAAIDAALSEHARMHGIGAVSLRYFNVAGAHGRFGERHATETHLIPIVLQVALGLRESVSLYGEDYATEDGTCVRDYIHVTDLADAHLLALGRCVPGTHQIYNLGNGTGFSVRQVVEVCREVTGHPIPAVTAARRPGDPAVLVASGSRAREVLGWRPRYPRLEQIVSDAWAFHTTAMAGNLPEDRL